MPEVLVEHLRGTELFDTALEAAQALHTVKVFTLLGYGQAVIVYPAGIGVRALTRVLHAEVRRFDPPRGFNVRRRSGM